MRVTPIGLLSQQPVVGQNGLMTLPWLRALTDRDTSTASGGSPSLYGTRAARIASYPAASYNAGTVFLESDTLLIYVATAAGAWQYFAGTYTRTQAQLAAFAATLGGNDAGLLVAVSDYAHALQWTGADWTWAPGEQGSGYFQDFAVAPTAAGWHACNGTTVPCLKSDGTTTSVLLPNSAATASYRKVGASYSAAIAAASVPLLTMNSYTPQGTNSVPVLTMASYTPQGTNSAPALTMNSYTPAGTNSAPAFTGTAVGMSNQVFVSVGGTDPALTSLNASSTTYTPQGTVAAPTFTGTPATLTGSVAAPTFTGAAHTLTGTVTAPNFTGAAAILTGTISLPADPVAHYQAIGYFRQ